MAEKMNAFMKNPLNVMNIAFGSKKKPPQETTSQKPPVIASTRTPTTPQKPPPTVSTGSSSALAEPVEEKIDNAQGMTMAAPPTGMSNTGTGAPVGTVPLLKREKTRSSPGPISRVSPAKPADKKTKMDKMNQGITIAGALGNMGATKAKGFLKDQKSKMKK